MRDKSDRQAIVTQMHLVQRELTVAASLIRLFLSMRFSGAPSIWQVDKACDLGRK